MNRESTDSQSFSVEEIGSWSIEIQHHTLLLSTAQRRPRRNQQETPTGVQFGKREGSSYRKPFTTTTKTQTVTVSPFQHLLRHLLSQRLLLIRLLKDERARPRKNGFTRSFTDFVDQFRINVFFTLSEDAPIKTRPAGMGAGNGGRGRGTRRRRSGTNGRKDRMCWELA